MENKQNGVGYAIHLVGVTIILAGSLAALVYGTNEELAVPGELQKIIAWSLFLSSIVWGIVFLGFAEVIKLLQGIYTDQRTIGGLKDPEPNEPYRASLEQKEAIYNYFSKQGKKIDIEAIESSPVEDVCLVMVDGEKLAVDLSGFETEIIAMEDLEKRMNSDKIDN